MDIDFHKPCGNASAPGEVDMSALTPFDANSDAKFVQRAALAICFEANRQFDPPIIELFGNEDDGVTRCIARLAWAGETVGVNHLAFANDLLWNTQVRSKVGTTVDKIGFKRTGEWDVALKGLVLILYRYRQKLRPEVYSHILHHLLNQWGGRPAGADLVPPIFLETENHVLMIESSRYLTNQLLLLEQWENGSILDDVAARVDEWLGSMWPDMASLIRPELIRLFSFDNEVNGMNDWMLSYLQQLLQHDFWEYNARPYQRYAMAALHNLNDFAWDERVQIAAHMVLDYISAKMAVSSDGLRRAVPFRRRGEYRDKSAFFGQTTDPQTPRFLVLSGLTTRLADVGFIVDKDASNMMVIAAASSYRVPDMILDLLMNRRHSTYYQRIHHGDRQGGFIPGGVEIYASSPEFLVSAGGIWIRSGNSDLDEFDDQGCGFALPTTLMPSNEGADWTDFIRIDGAFNLHHQINTGVAPGFACGLNVVIPLTFSYQEGALRPQVRGLEPMPYHSCVTRVGNWIFINASESCLPSPHRRAEIYIAAYIEECKTADCLWAHRPLAFNASNFGFFEVVPARVTDFETFKNTVFQKNGNRQFTSEGINEYETFDGRHIHFTPNPSDDKYRWSILAIDGNVFDTNIHDWPLAQGDVINSVGHSGILAIDDRYLQQRMVLNMADARVPRRYQYRTNGPRHCAGALVSKDMYRLDAFWVSPDGAVWTTNWDRYADETRWAVATPITRAGEARWNSDLVSLARNSEHLDLFWITPAGAIATAWWDPHLQAGVRFPSFRLTRPNVASDSSGLTAVARTPDHLDVFWVAEDGSIWSHWWDGTEAESAWDRHAASAITPPHAARPYSKLASCSRVRGHADLFWIGIDGAIWSTWSHPDVDEGQWHPPFRISPVGSARVDSALTCNARTPEHVDVFWIAPNGAVSSAWWDPNGGWRIAFQLTEPAAAGPGSGLAAAARVQSVIDLFWIAPDGSVAGSYFDVNANPAVWTQYQVAPAGAALTYSSVHTFACEPEHLDVLWIGPQNQWRSQWWDSRSPVGAWDGHGDFAITEPESVQQPPWTYPHNESRGAVSRGRIRLDLLWSAPERAVAHTSWAGTTALARWSMFHSITPDGSMPDDPPPVGVARTPGDLDVFWIAKDWSVMRSGWNLREHNDSWSPGTAVAPPNSARTDSSLAAATRSPEWADVFWISPEGAVACASHSEHLGWHATSIVTAKDVARAASPLALLATAPDGLAVFWIGPDGSPQFSTGTPPRGFYHLGTAAGGFVDPAVVPAPGPARADSPLAVTARLPDQLDLFWIGDDGGVWSTWRGPGSVAWDQPFLVSGQHLAAPGSPLAVIARRPTRIDLFWRGADGTIWTNAWDAEAVIGWDGLTAISPAGGGRLDTPIYLAANTPYTVNAFWFGTDRALWTNWYDARLNGGNWYAPFQITTPNSV